MKKLIPFLIVFSLFLTGCTAGLSEDEARTKTEEFINNTLMAGAPVKATIKEVTKEKGLFKIVVDAGGQTIDSYLTTDGEIFFPQAMNIEEVMAEAEAMKNLAPPPAPVPDETLEEAPEDTEAPAE